MGARFDRLRCEVFQNLFLSPMNTGFVRPAVATVLTVYGIETTNDTALIITVRTSQQYLPFTVLKPAEYGRYFTSPIGESQQYLPFTVLKHIQTAIFSNE